MSSEIAETWSNISGFESVLYASILNKFTWNISGIKIPMEENGNLWEKWRVLCRTFMSKPSKGGLGSSAVRRKMRTPNLAYHNCITIARN